MRKRLTLMSIAILAVQSLYIPASQAAPVTYAFNNATATGYSGPSQAQVDAAYSGTSLANSVTVVGLGYQKWTVPTSGTYSFEVCGAAGGAANTNTGYRGGKGAIVTATKYLTAGQTLIIVVGQSGSANGNNGSGGGASVVAFDTSTNINLIVAGGGGGSRFGAVANGGDADTSTTGSGRAPSSVNLSSVTSWGSNTVAGTYSTNQTIIAPIQGTAGAAYTTLGYGGLSATSNFGDGGSGWLGNGYDDTTLSNVATRLSGGALGGYSSGGGNIGGFGGGASGSGSSGGGGGGGYTGGNGGWLAGGGGTYVNGYSSVSVVLDSRSFMYNGSQVHGYVNITSTSQPISIGFGTNTYEGIYRQNLTITVTMSSPVSGGDGVVTFYANRKRIPECKSVRSASGSATCIFKPTLHGAITLTALWKPTDTSYDSSSTGPVTARIVSRINNR